MKFRGSFAKKVEEKPPVVVTGTISSLSTPQNITPHSHEQAEASPSQTPIREPETPPWDFFGLSHPIDSHFSSREQEVAHGFEFSDDLGHDREHEGFPELEDEEENVSCRDQSQGSESEDEFDDDPSSDTLVRSFKNLNREESLGTIGASPSMPTVANTASENELVNEEKINSPKLSPLKTMANTAKSSETMATPRDAKVTPMKGDSVEHKIAPKDFVSSMRDVEYLFVKASDSGKEVPRMLEANKLHFRPLLPGQEPGASATSSLLKACFSCGEDPSQVQEEPAQTSVKYLTWHRTTSSRSSSSRNPLAPNSREDVEDLTSGIFESMCMISGSHASTLDRLFAWERKLYDEVKASQVVRRDYDMKCKLLREQESRCESQNRIDKTRAVVKDLHSRIRVAIHRIDTISRRIEDMRDKELQPQLEEIIEGLQRMWEVMFECHKLQLHIISISFSNNTTKLSLHSESHRLVAAQLQDNLTHLSLTFTKWVNSLRTYVQAINDWLRKCVSVQEKSSKKRRWMNTPLELRLRNSGPPIYTTCGAWLDSLKELPVKEVSDAIKGLAAEVSPFLPQTQGKKGGPEMLSTPQESFEDWNTGYDRFKQGLVHFLTQMGNFAERSSKMYGQLHTDIEDAKRTYEHKMSQP